MELWFIVAVIGAVMSGVSNFFFKIAAIKNLNAELFILYSSLTSLLTLITILYIWPEQIFGFGAVLLVIFVSGLISAVAGSLKVYVLRYIDATIYFPLFKLIVPALAIVIGVTYFQETFTAWQWIGMVLGLLVPLVLITPAENSRQNNLKLGILLIAITGLLSTATAVAGKYATEMSLPVNTILLYTVLGIVSGSIILVFHKHGLRNVKHIVLQDTSKLLLAIAMCRSVLIVGGVWAMLFAYANGGTLSVVQTIHSMYILIPIVLAIVFFNEHWNIKKIAAIVFSVLALILLG